MKPAAPNFDRLASPYRLLEFLAFGRDLERARFSLLPALRDSRHILVLGEGDGRCLEKLITIAPEAAIDCLDLSAAMLARAQRRLGNQAKPVTFRHADILATDLPAKHYDAVITCFFLDCFSKDQAADIIARISRSLQTGALWLWADFTLPSGGPARWRARLWLRILYIFFRWQTGLQTRELPPTEKLFKQHRLINLEQRTLQWGLVRCGVFRKTDKESVLRPDREY